MLTPYQKPTVIIDFLKRKALFVWGFTPYQQYCSDLTVTVHTYVFPGLFLTRT